MKQGQASRTAAYVALFRAIESSRGDARRLFHDPFAHLFLEPDMQRMWKISRAPFVGNVLLKYSDRKWPGVRSAAVARTCYIDAALRAVLKAGIEQVVILGAGYDCRAYRIAELAQCRVFEVDHPATLARKRDTLLRELPAIPAHVRQVVTDFNERSFAMEMIDAGYDPAHRTFFIWEGVTGYLKAEAVDATLRWIASSARDGELVFTYLHKGLFTNPESFGDLRHVQSVLKNSNEPWVFGIDPAEACGYLAARGLELLEDLGADEFRARYLSGWPGGLRGYAFYRVALARICGG